VDSDESEEINELDPVQGYPVDNNDDNTDNHDNQDAEDESYESENPRASKTEYTTDSITLYLNKLNKVRLLKREEEISLAQQIERGTQKSRKTLSRSLVVAAEIERIAAQIHDGTLTVASVFEYPQTEDDLEEPEAADPRTEELLTTLPTMSAQFAKVRS